MTRTRINGYQYQEVPATNYIESGCIWTADSPGSTLAASMTAGVVWIGGKRLTVAAVTSRAFTASVDTYVDFQDNGDGTANITYSTVTNNAASAALGNSGTTANTIRNAIIVSGATNIAAASSINQGSPWASLPTTTASVALAVCDTIGNLIYPRPGQKLIGQRVYPTGAGPTVTTPSSLTQISAGLNVPILAANVPNSGNIAAQITTRAVSSSAGIPDVQICMGSTSGQSICDFSGSTTVQAMCIRGVYQVTANTTAIPAVVCTASGNVSLQAYNNSLVVTVELD